MQTHDFGTIVREIAKKQGISQAELAQRSKVSRVQINRIFGGGAGAVRAETRQRIATALGLDEAALSGMDVLQCYRQKMREKYLVKSLAGLGFTELHCQPLSTFYVPPAGRLGQFKKHENVPSSRCAAVVGSNDDLAPALDSIKANRRVVVLGIPGAGKSTLLQFLVTESAAGNFGKTDTPIFVRLPEFALAMQSQPNLTVFDWIVSQAEEMDCPDIVEPMLEQLKRPGSTLALFDGLDEVPSSDCADNHGGRLRNARSRVIDAIRDFVNQFRSQRFVVTSRLSGFDDSPWGELGFLKVTLEEYGDEEIRTAVTKWSTILANSKHEPASKIASELSASIFENSRVRQLAKNPLILTILILMCKARGYAIPRRRVDLYEKVTEVFLDSWESSKRKEHGFRETGNIDLEPRELKWLIAELALSMQRAGLFTAHRWWVVDLLRGMLCNRLGFDATTATKQADPILRFISARTGLLDERMPGVFAFTHRTMQEYFAAIGLIEDSVFDPLGASLTEMLRPYFFHPEWTEVVRLVAAQVSPKPAEELLKAIVDDADQTGQFLRRGPFTALRCLADGATVSDRTFVQNIFASLRDLGRSPWLGITMECLAALQLLNGTRYEQPGSELAQHILSTAKEMLNADECRALSLAAHKPTPVNLDSLKNQANAPVLKLIFRSGEEKLDHYIPNVALFSSDPSEWQTAAGNWLEQDGIADDAKQAIIWFMQYAFDGERGIQKRIRIRLKRTLGSSQSESVRSAAAHALGMIPKGGVGVSSTLLKRLKDTTEADEVRSACAMALERTAATDLRTRNILLNMLNDLREKECLREAAAFGLEESANDEDVSFALFTIANSDPPNPLSIACIASLSPAAVRFKDSLVSWLEEDSIRKLPAARVLAEAYISGRLRWSDHFARHVEDSLRGTGTGSSMNFAPCSHILTIIKQLCDVRERRGGLRRETVVGDALASLATRIQFAFIYGSVARDDQEQDSDIDLMVIGTVSPAEISVAVKQMKAKLGREVNPTICSLQEIRQRFQSDDHLITRIIDSQKIFVCADDVTATERNLLDELNKVEAPIRA